MKRRLVVLSVSAVIVLAAFGVGAALLPSACPGGWHELGSGGCQTDATHVAPSSGVRIPVAMMFHRDPRLGMRAGMIVVGLLLASGLVWVGLKGGQPEGDEDMTVVA